MKKSLIILNTVYLFLFVCGSVFAVGERTIDLGGSAAWTRAETRTNIIEARSLRPHPVLILSSASVSQADGYSAATGVLGNFSQLAQPSLDMSISFDESRPELFRDITGNYRLTVPSDLEVVDRLRARAGNGAALFGRSGADRNTGPLVIQPQGREALFSNGNRLRDFSIEFWVFPQNMVNGEQILSWVAVRQVNGHQAIQRINCVASRNRLQWSFVNFFASSTNGNAYLNLEFSGNTPVVPRRWSHHIIRFDATTGLLEYLVDGSSETIIYATSTGRENSEVHTPVIGANGNFLIGESFNGLIDEFKVHNACIGRSSIHRYSAAGGRMQTSPIDLGESASGVMRINVTGGRTSLRGTSVRNEFRENGRFKFSDDSEMNFFIRASERSYDLGRARWVHFTPGSDVSGIQGRYVQIAVDFYPSADGESSPYLEQMHIVYMPGEVPLPPRNFTAIARDGKVELRWRISPSQNTEGYRIYYSGVRGELFGTDAFQGSSPIDAGNRNSFVIEGLANGTLYYFRVAAYTRVSGEINEGEFTAEVTARPLAGLDP
ncbi:MAG: fibronectin type III domain-containing protein [Treponema sp.]|nr:fibronectin type III domain-containing protein [Treponema sp.]MCL2237189.1 fibronectin type III domain-containing protein [Treponema sp.]